MEQQIVALLNQTYSVDNDVRSQAEEALSRLDPLQEFPQGLISLGSNLLGNSMENLMT